MELAISQEMKMAYQGRRFSFRDVLTLQPSNLLLQKLDILLLKLCHSRIYRHFDANL